jgi:hypothetical protein
VALAGAGRAGRLPRLSDQQVAEVGKALLAGPGANGFGTDLWALAGVADVIERLTGVLYRQTRIWEILCNLTTPRSIDLLLRRLTPR